jgi:cytidylate kinase
MSASEAASPRRDDLRPSRPVVTLAAFYGAGGTVVGPRVAERLGVEFLDRGILKAVAERMHLPEEAAAGYDEPQQEGGIGRLLGSLARVPISDAAPVDSLVLDEHRYRAETEEFIAAAAVSGGVILGRGGQVVLQSVPGVLHVMLRGPRDARVRQGMEVEGIDQRTAQRRLEANDRARIEYVRQAYGVDPLDRTLYHLIVDSTAIDLDTCVDIIVAASQARMRQVRPAGQA